MPKVFVSFSFRDRGFVCNLCEDLRLLDLPIWFSLLEIDQDRPYDDYELKRELEQALKGCQAVVIFVSDHSVGSTWVALELEVARQERCQIIPLTDAMMRAPMPHDIRDYDPIRFDRGYKTALSKIFRRINPSGKNAKGLAVEDNRRTASRTYADGRALSDCLSETAIPESVKAFLLRIRKFIAAPAPVLRRYFQSNAPSPHDIVEYARAATSDHTQVDCILEGNSANLQENKDGKGWTVALSFLPLFLPGRPPQSPMESLLISAWPSTGNIDSPETVSMGIEMEEDDSGRVWMASRGRLDRFSLGSSEVDAHLLTSSLKMGAGKYVFEWPWREPDREELASMQRMSNFLGQGMVQKKDVDPTLRGTDPLFDSVRDRLVDQEKWAIPLVSQTTCFWSHLANGGFFYYDERFVVPPLLSLQIKLFCEAAGGVFRRKEKDICMCIDPHEARSILKPSPGP